MQKSILYINGVVIDRMPTVGWSYFFYKTGLIFFAKEVNRLTKNNIEEIERVRIMWQDCYEDDVEKYNCCLLDDDEKERARIYLNIIRKIQNALKLSKNMHISKLVKSN